ncbi:hypothetical protein QL285_034975 [Trifolium repens]|nr:hypothetical protein QL285_034975 [Trifolium repens]
MAILGEQDMKNPLQLTASSFPRTFERIIQGSDSRTFSDCSFSLTSFINFNELSFFIEEIGMYPLQTDILQHQASKYKASAINKVIGVFEEARAFTTIFSLLVFIVQAILNLFFDLFHSRTVIQY